LIRIFFQQRILKSTALLQKWNVSKQAKPAIVALKMVCIQKKESIMLSFNQKLLPASSREKLPLIIMK